MAATYPGSVPSLAALVLSNPQTYAQFTRFVEEMQAVLDTLGANPHSSYGTVDARQDALEARLNAASNLGYRGLRLSNNTTTPTTKYDVVADSLAVEGYLLTNVAVTVDLTATGKNGMTHARAINTNYHVWVGFKPSTAEVCAIFDDSPSRSSIDVTHATLAGFTAWRRVGARRTNGTSTGELPRMTQIGDIAIYDAHQDIASGGAVTAGTWQTRTVTSAPSTARQVQQWFEYSAAASSRLLVSEVGIDSGHYAALTTAGTFVTFWATCDASQAFRWTAAVNSFTAWAMYTLGYRDQI